MSSSAGGPLGALLMIAPLAAIPVLAVVGVPQFAPVVASSSDEEGVDEADEQFEEPAAQPGPKRGSANDLFAPFEERGVGRVPSYSKSAAPEKARWMGGPTGVAGKPKSRGASQAGLSADADDDVDGRARPARRGAATPGISTGRATLDEELVAADEFTPGLVHPVTRLPQDGMEASAGQGVRAPSVRANPSIALGAGRGTDQPSVANAADVGFGQVAEEQSGWAAAAARLKLLGIRRHQLDPRIEVNNRVRFVFTCYLAEGNGSRVVQHFSRVADTPLDAIEATLDAVERWRAEVQRSDPSADETGFLNEEPSGPT